MSKQIIDLGEAARADEETFDEEPTCKKCDCFITVDSGDEVTPYCNDCAHTLVEDFEKREPLVQDVIRHATDFAALSMVAVDIPFSEHTKRTVARIETRSALLEAARKLAEWSPT